MNEATIIFTRLSIPLKENLLRIREPERLSSFLPFFLPTFFCSSEDLLNSFIPLLGQSSRLYFLLADWGWFFSFLIAIAGFSWRCGTRAGIKEFNKSSEDVDVLGEGEKKKFRLVCLSALVWCLWI